MNEAGLNAAPDRQFNRFERKLRRLEVAVILLACIAVVLVAVRIYRTIGVPANISARGFSLVDESGNVLASLARTPVGGVLVFESKSGSEKVLLGTLENEAGLGLTVRDQVRASLMVGADGLPAMTLRDSKGRARITSGLDREDLPIISVWNEKGRLDFLVRPGRSPILEVFDEDGSSLFSVRPKKAEKPGTDSSPRPRVIP